MDYFDTHNILLQKNDNYADFLEYTHTGGPKNFYTIVPNLTFFYHIWQADGSGVVSFN
jgi:hypothetical protein